MPQEDDDAEVRPFASLFARIGSANGSGNGAPNGRSTGNKRPGGGGGGRDKDKEKEKAVRPPKSSTPQTTPSKPAQTPATPAEEGEVTPPKSQNQRKRARNGVDRADLPKVPVFAEAGDRDRCDRTEPIDIDDEELSVDDRETVQRFQSCMGEFKEMFPPSGDDTAFAHWLKAHSIIQVSNKL